ncbi:MAG: glycoside hydrolase family 38 C-terminal domain-containing protein [Trueperaceae bacterium]
MSVSNSRIVVHMIGNAHIDPVWLWGWQAGVDEALASFRSAADRCDEYPDFIYTRGEAWLYRQIENLDTELFARIGKLVGRGQWHVAGGQFLQPDVNAPTVMGLRRQIEHGRRYFESRFGLRPAIGYNLDSFGHPATLPDLLQQQDYRGYVFHRPKPDQVPLPAPAFIWRGAGGGEVMAFRIVPGYTTLGEDLTDHIMKAAELADPKVGHAMCFFGVGNHGGGPTKSDIEFILEHRDAFDGVELRFSTPETFFDELEGKRGLLPVVSEELQRTFPGCYSVMHDVKQAQRCGEHLCDQAQRSIEAFGGERSAKLTAKLDSAWEDLLFTAFHDILAGTSIPSAWPSVRAMQGRARIMAEEIIVESSRAWARLGVPPVDHQQLIVLNPNDASRPELVEAEPWLDMDSWGTRWLSDSEGQPLDYQLLQPEAPQITTRLLIPVTVAAKGALQILVRDDPSPELLPVVSDLRVDENGLANEQLELRVNSGGISELRAGGRDLLGEGGISLHLREDHTDTWTFHTDRFTEPVGEVFEGAGWEVEERGPIRARLRNEGRIGTSRLRWTVDLYRGEPRVAMRVEVNYDERFRLLQVPIRFAQRPSRWLSGLAGGWVEREFGETEWPVQGWSRADFADDPSNGASGETLGVRLALLTQDAYSLSCREDGWQWTLLRSPRMAWGGGNPKPYAGRDWFADQGVHVFDFELHVGDGLEPRALEERASGLVQPLILFDRYDGMNRPLGRRKSSAPVQALFQRNEEEAG